MGFPVLSCAKIVRSSFTPRPCRCRQCQHLGDHFAEINAAVDQRLGVSQIDDDLVFWNRRQNIPFFDLKIH